MPRGGPPRSALEQGRAQAVLADPPEVVRLPVHQGDRDLLPVALVQVRVVQDAALLEALPQLGGHPGDDLAGVVAEVAAGLADQQHPGRRRPAVWFGPAGRSGHSSASRSRPLATLPVTECGSSSTTSTVLGRLKRASRVAAWASTSSAVRVLPSTGTTNACTASPVCGSGTPTTAASATPGCWTSASSTSRG